jgi:hypothetical protein
MVPLGKVEQNQRINWEYIGETLDILAKVTQVSDMAHWPLVSSPELKAQVSFSDRRLSVVRL